MQLIRRSSSRFLKGGISATIAGGKFMDGFRQGLITAGLNHVAHRIAMDFQKYDYTNNGETFGSQEELDEFINKNIGDVNNIEAALKTDITLASASNLPEGYSFEDGGMLNKRGTPAGGSTIHINANGKISKIYISPNAKGDFFGTVSAAKMEIVHELVHANHLFKGLSGYNTYSEAAASMYTFAYLKAYGSRNGASFYYKNLMNYPRAYSWRNLPSFINTGIK